MKKGIIVLLIMVMVAGFAFAVAEPTFEGQVKAGYTLYMGGDATPYSWGSGKELKLSLGFTGDYWKVTVKSLDGTIGSKGTLAANVTMDIDKLVNMGDFKLSLNAGNNNNTEILSSFNDWKDDEYYKLKIAGSETKAAAKITAAYKAVKLQFAMDPTSAAKYNGGAYSISAQAAINDGINISAGYVYNALTTAIGKDTSGKSATVKANWYARNAIGASFSIDIAKLASMDGKFKISFYDNVLLGLGLSKVSYTGEDKVNTYDYSFGNGQNEKAGNANSLAVNVEGGYGKVLADLEFRAMNGNYSSAYTTVTTNKESKEAVKTSTPFSANLKDYALRAKVKYTFNDNWGAFIKGGLDSFDFQSGDESYGCWDLGGGVNFKIFNVDFGWQSFSKMYQSVNKTTAKGEFTIQPYFDLKF